MPTLLFVTEVPPAPVSDGATRRAKAMLDVLLSRYAVIGLFIGSEEDMQAIVLAYPQMLWLRVPSRGRKLVDLLSSFSRAGTRLGFVVDHYLLGDWSRTTRYGPARRIVRKLEREGQIDGVFGLYLQTIWQVGHGSVPVVADVDDDLLEWMSMGKTPDCRSVKGILTHWRDTVIGRRYRRALNQLAAAIFVRTDDTQRLSGHTRTFYAPNQFVSVHRRSVRQPAETRLRVGLIAGALTPANIEGTRWFVREVVEPLLKDKALSDQLEFVFAGRISEFVRDEYQHLTRMPTIRVKGIVDDVTYFYDEIDVATSPVLFGGGSSVKFFEALAYGMPVIATECGARGYDGPTGAGIIIADDPEIWRRRIGELALQRDALIDAYEHARSAQQKILHAAVVFRKNVLGACSHAFGDTVDALVPVSAHPRDVTYRPVE